MNKLSNEELLEVQAGGLSRFTVGIAVGVGVFIVGVIDGQIRLK